jgi:serine/threonine protein kinase
VLRRELAVGEARKQFLEEAKAAAAVEHKHIVTIHHKPEDGPVPYIVMEFVDGTTLQRKLDKLGALDVKEILRIGQQIADGLASAHDQGLVHRDIKPANILLKNHIEQVKITDFGLAKVADFTGLARPDAFAGTPAFTSPEQAAGMEIDHRSDLFSLGSVLYAMCTGLAPFRGKSVSETLGFVRNAEPTPIRSLNPQVPIWLAEIVSRLHRKKPDERFRSAADVAKLLMDKLRDLQSSTTSKADGENLHRRHKASRTPIVLAMVGVILATIVIGNEIWQAWKLRQTDQAVVNGKNVGSSDHKDSGQDVPRTQIDADRQPDRSTAEDPVLEIMSPKVIGTGPEAVIGFDLPTNAVFQNDQPTLRVQSKSAIGGHLMISRLVLCRTHLVQTGTREFVRGSVKKTIPFMEPVPANMWIPATGSEQVAGNVETQNGSERIVRPSRPLPDGVYCLHSGSLTPYPPPVLAVPFVVRGYGEAVLVRAALERSDSAVAFRVVLRNDGKGQLNDGFMRVTLMERKIGKFGNAVNYLPLDNQDIPVVSAGDLHEMVSRWKLVDIKPGDYYFHCRVTDRYLKSDGTKWFEVDSEGFTVPTDLR